MEPPEIVAGKKLLITGGTGTVGSEIVRQALGHGAEVVRVYSRDEYKQFLLRQQLGDDPRLRFLIGDVRDAGRLRRALEDIDIVFHTAAMKHVAACEYNPSEALKTNALGTENVIEAALERDVDLVMLTSTDKAVNPSNTMGASKLLAEKLMTAANCSRGPHPTRFATVRFGNVLGSNGSLLTILREQIARGGPVTLTDPQMTRYVLSLSEAVGMVFRAAAMARGGEVFILKMPRVRTADLVAAAREVLAPRFGFKPQEIETRLIGAGPGEKIHEELMTSDERLRAYETDEMVILLPPLAELGLDPSAYPGSRPLGAAADDAIVLSTDEIMRLLCQGDVAACLAAHVARSDSSDRHGGPSGLAAGERAA